ncbi:MAG: 3'(2'),5'-bisphosphate nucleotidase CysQ, partial [Fulvivirga sp.]|nr:3'(2'),5'-bisphosphate nucleotidase CysQ [Fulvivirga sp.]
MNINTKKLLEVTREAGQAILKVYAKSDFSNVVSYKDDNSPLTLADTAAHKIIMTRLEEQYP